VSSTRDHLLCRRSPAWLLLLVAAGLGPRLLAQASWSHRHADELNSNYLPLELDAAGLRFAWRRQFAAGSDVSKALIVPEGVLLSLTRGRAMLLLDPATGADRWQLTFPGASSVSPPSYADGRLYFFTSSGVNDAQFRCHRASDGVELYQRAVFRNDQPRSGGTLADGRLLHESRLGFAAFEIATGAELWDGPIESSMGGYVPAVLGGRAYVPRDPNSPSAGINVVEASTGIVLPPLTTSHGAPPIGSLYPDRTVAIDRSGRFAAIVDRGTLMVFDLASGELAWRLHGGYDQVSAIRDGVIYASGFRAFDARELATGRIVWSQPTPASSFDYGCIVTDSHAFLTRDGRVGVFDLTTGAMQRELDAYGICSIAPGLLMVIASNQGIVSAFAFDARPGVVSLEPSTHSAFANPPARVRVRGSGFAENPSLRVFFGGSEATDISVLSDAELVCTPPSLSSGDYDVRIEDARGSDVLVDGYSRIPSLALLGARAIDSELTVRLRSAAGDFHVILYGAPPSVRVATPSYQGELCIAVPGMLALFAFDPRPEVTLRLAVPGDPALVGVPLLLQSLSGPLLAQPHDTAWTNCESLILR
jgi:outer membrane protein assembly factor BamB